MVDWELFIHLAEIAGVFVGFGALIAVRSKGVSDPHTVEYLRGVVSGGLLVVAAALAPLTLSRFGLEGRALWVPCSIFFFVVFLVFWVADARSSENRIERKVNRGITIRMRRSPSPDRLCPRIAPAHHRRRVAPARSGPVLPGRDGVADRDGLHPVLAGVDA